MKQEIQDTASVKGEDVEVKLESQSQNQHPPELQQPVIAVKAEVLDDNVNTAEPANGVNVVALAPEESAGPSGEAGIQQQPQQQDRIQAYAKLQFPFFNFYIQKLSVTIGRRPPESRIPPKDEPLPPALNGSGFEQEDAKPKREEAGDVHAEEDVKETPTKQEEAHVNGFHADATPAVKPEQSSQQQADQQQPEQAEGDITSGEALAKLEEESQTRQTTPKKEEEDSQSLRPSTPMPSLLPDGLSQDVQPVASTSALPPPPQSTPGRFQGNKVQVDVDLGPIKAVSRDHARLFFDTNTHPITGASNGWSIEVRGRNGLVLDGRWRAKDEVIKLTNRSKIQIAERIFFFVLPNGVPYPSAPASPTMSNTYWDEHYMNDMNGYPQSPGRSPSPPLVYGSDSDELRSDDDMHQKRRGSSSMSTNSRSRNASHAPTDGVTNDQNEAIDPVTGKRKRGRPPKTRTAEELEERNKRSDPTIPRRPRGRPPKYVPPEEPTEEGGAAGPDAQAAAKEAKKLSKKQQSEAKKAERERIKAEKAEAKEREKKEKEAIKEAAKAAKKAEKEKADKEKKEKDKEVKEKEAKEKAEKDRIAREEEDKKKKREAEDERRKILAIQQATLQQPPAQQPAAVAPPTQLALPKPAPPAPAAVIPGQIDQIPSWTPTNQFIGRPDQPPYSYAALIAQAIYATPHKQAQIGHIQSWIPDKYPYFREHAPMLQAAIRKDLAVNRAFVNIPLQSGIALWAVEPEQAKYFDGNTFLPPPTADPAAPATPSPALQSARLAPLASPSVASPSPQPAAAPPSKTPILISTLPPSYIKPSPTSSADPSSMLDPNGFPPIAIHEDKMYLSPSIFATLTAQQLSNLQTLDTKQALNILQAFVVNYFKTELKKRKKAEKAAAAAAAAAQQNGNKRSAEEALDQPSKVQKVA